MQVSLCLERRTESAGRRSSPGRLAVLDGHVARSLAITVHTTALISSSCDFVGSPERLCSSGWIHPPGFSLTDLLDKNIDLRAANRHSRSNQLQPVN